MGRAAGEMPPKRMPGGCGYADLAVVHQLVHPVVVSVLVPLVQVVPPVPVENDKHRYTGTEEDKKSDEEARGGEETGKARDEEREKRNAKGESRRDNDMMPYFTGRRAAGRRRGKEEAREKGKKRALPRIVYSTRLRAGRM